MLWSYFNFILMARCFLVVKDIELESSRKSMLLPLIFKCKCKSFRRATTIRNKYPDNPTT